MQSNDMCFTLLLSGLMVHDLVVIYEFSGYNPSPGFTSFVSSDIDPYQQKTRNFLPKRKES